HDSSKLIAPSPAATRAGVASNVPATLPPWDTPSRNSAREKRQARVHAVVDAGVRAVELLVAVLHAMCREPLRQEPAAVVNVVLIAPTAVDEYAAQRAQVARIARDEVDRIVREPAPPARRDQLARLEIERHAKAVRRARVGVVARGHREIHEAVHFGVVRPILAPEVLEEVPHAAVV